MNSERGRVSLLFRETVLLDCELKRPWETPRVSGLANVKRTGPVNGTGPCPRSGLLTSLSTFCPLPVPNKAAKGVWKIEALQVLDKANNLKLYSQSDPVAANVSFTVQ